MFINQVTYFFNIVAIGGNGFLPMIVYHSKIMTKAKVKARSKPNPIFYSVFQSLIGLQNLSNNHHKQQILMSFEIIESTDHELITFVNQQVVVLYSF